MDWKAIFLPNVPLLEIILRGTVTYLAIFIMLRVVLKRESGGAVGITDMLLIVLIADAAQNAMAGGYTTITGGLVLVGTIIFWSFALDWLANTFPFLDRLIHKPPLLVVEDGKMLRRNMRKELIMPEEINAELRKVGIEDLDKVKKMFMEGDGNFSVIRKDDQQVDKPKKKPAG